VSQIERRPGLSRGQVPPDVEAEAQRPQGVPSAGTADMKEAASDASASARRPQGPQTPLPAVETAYRPDYRGRISCVICHAVMWKRLDLVRHMKQKHGLTLRKRDV